MSVLLCTGGCFYVIFKQTRATSLLLDITKQSILALLLVPIEINNVTGVKDSTYLTFVEKQLQSSVECENSRGTHAEITSEL